MNRFHLICCCGRIPVLSIGWRPAASSNIWKEMLIWCAQISHHLNFFWQQTACLCRPAIQISAHVLKNQGALVVSFLSGLLFKILFGSFGPCEALETPCQTKAWLLWALIQPWDNGTFRNYKEEALTWHEVHYIFINDVGKGCMLNKIIVLF